MAELQFVDFALMQGRVIKVKQHSSYLAAFPKYVTILARTSYSASGFPAVFLVLHDELSRDEYTFCRTLHYPFPPLVLHHFLPTQTGFTGLI